jgi:thiol:disulfide interchange protein DsbD
MLRLLRYWLVCIWLSSPFLWADLSLSASNSATPPGQEEFLPVEQAYQADMMFSNGQWQVIWQLADGYFLYKHGFKNEWNAQGNLTASSLALPDGIQKTDEYFGKVETYYQQVMIPITSPSQAQGTVLFKATSQGCADAGLCYPPYSVYFSVDQNLHRSQIISAEQFNAALSSVAKPVELEPSTSIAWILLSALLGGLILNLMPCVLPVLSIKVMQLARHPNSPQARLESSAYLAGVILSFVTVAAIMLALRTTGTAVGWGFQLQNPWFIAGLVYVFFVLALSMAGVLQFGHRWMGMGQSLTGKGGISGAFFTGVLAVVVASPCTAPFMSAALGFAITQPNAVALLIFAVLGLGMALPVTLVSFIPAASKLLPKPGMWMEKLKQLFAFPLFGTAIWLLWVFGKQTSTQGMALLLAGCLCIAFAIWCFQGSRFISKVIAIAALFLAALLPLSTQWSKTTATEQNHTPYSAQALQQLRSQGKPVFVDLTADWCITCIANEKSTLETAVIQQAFADAGIVYMVGDWTDYNPEITALLTQYQRSGIPLYLLYPANPDLPAMILPQILTPSLVLDYIEKIDSKH